MAMNDKMSFCAPNGIRIVLVIENGKVIDGLLDLRDIQPCDQKSKS